MLKLAVAVLAIALAGSASAGGWRSLRIDASSEASFTESVAAFHEKLSGARSHVFTLALQDIWAQGTKAAKAEQREYTTSEYLRQLDGLRYEEIVTFTDPTGSTAQQRYREGRSAAYMAARRNAPSGLSSASASSGTADRTSPPIVNGQQMRGATPADRGFVTR